MNERAAVVTASLLACALLAPGLPARAAVATPKPAVTAAAPVIHSDYAEVRFTTPLSAGLKHFYAKEFKEAQVDFETAVRAMPDNTLAISFMNAAAAQRQGELEVLANVEEDAVSGLPKSYANRVKLGFTYMFQSALGRDRSQDAREELNAAVALNPDAAAAHVGLGILRFNERSANRAKTELQLALKADPNNVLAREYLGQLYQTDLRDPQRGLSYVIDVPNLVPGYADILFHIGSLLHDLKQPDAGIEYLRRGLAIDTGHVGEAGQHGYTLIARILLEQKKVPEAEKVLNDAVKADVDTIYAKTLLSKIKAGDYGTPSPSPKPR